MALSARVFPFCEVTPSTRSSEDGIVKLTHHKLRQPQDIVSRTTPEYSMGRLAARQPVNLTMPSSGIREIRSRMGSNLKGVLVAPAASAACRVKGTLPPKRLALSS